MANTAEKLQEAPQQLPESLMKSAEAITNAAAIACYDWIGKGDNTAADQAAVNAMRQKFNATPIAGTVVIGEGERDEAPMLYIGEEVGCGDLPVDIALDPLEGTTVCAKAAPNSIAVLALATEGGFLHAPDVYMEKIAVGAGLPEGVVDLDNSPAENLANVAKAKGCAVSDLFVTILDRPRHEELIAQVREAGARIQLIGDGDVTAVMATSMPETGCDIYMGIGGAPEGVLASAALRCMGGQMQGRLVFKDDTQKERAKRMGVVDPNKKYTHKEMASGDVIFAATGVTDGFLLKGVKKNAQGKFKTHSIVMHSSGRSLIDIKEYKA